MPSETLAVYLPRNYETGGMSGGPVLAMRERHCIMSFLVGDVITEGRSAPDTIVAVLADFIRAHGSI
jgi:hypothetical protein